MRTQRRQNGVQNKQHTLAHAMLTSLHTVAVFNSGVVTLLMVHGNVDSRVGTVSRCRRWVERGKNKGREKEEEKEGSCICTDMDVGFTENTT